MATASEMGNHVWRPDSLAANRAAATTLPEPRMRQIEQAKR
jgi:hypothetical protein